LAASLAACVTVAALCATPALASHNQTELFEAGQDLLNPATRPTAFTQMQELGVKAIRVELYWANVAPGADDAVRPSFDATDPASYHWGEYEAILDEAQRLKWQVLLTVTSPVPRWATANGTAPYLTRPDNLEFQEFMTAVARQFGSQVSLYAIWNEPNQPGWLRPQFNANGTPASPRIYRGLFQAGYAGLQAAGIAQPKVLIGETAPFGESSINTRELGIEQDVSPLAFLRGMLCLNADYHKSATCSELHPYGYSHHPYTLPAGPFYSPPNQDDVTIGTLARLTGALARAAHAGALPPRLPIYLTEFGFNTKPSQIGVSGAQQAQFDAISERIAWEDPDVAAFSQYQLQDDPIPASRHKGFTGFQTGLESALGTPKPLFYSFPVPLTVTRVGRGYSLWGLVRPADGSTELTVLVRRPGAKRYRTLRTVRTNALGYWSVRSSASGVDWRVRWVSPSGRAYEGPPIGAYR
jgi:Cellulase (glycosyl hydrolase family 5)